MKNKNMMLTLNNNIMGRPPPSWILELYSHKLIKDDELYTREFLSRIFKKHPRTIADVIENAYLKLYKESFPVIREANNMHIIVKYQGKILRKLSREYSEFIDGVKKSKK